MKERAEHEPDATVDGGGAMGGWADTPRAPWLIGLALGTLAVYSPAARHDFISFDDPAYVTENQHVRGGLTGGNFVWAWQTGYNANWHPLTWISHMLDCEMFGGWAGGHHLVSAGFHAINTGLLFLVLAGMTGAPRRSAVVAGLFGLHPLHVESVAWVSERKDVLSACFFFLTLNAYAKYAKSEGRKPKSEGNPKVEFRRTSDTLDARRSHTPRYYALSLLFFALGLMSKQVLVTTPFVLLLLDYWPLRRFERSRSAGGALAGLVLEKLPFLGLSAAASVVTWIVQRRGGGFADGLSVGARVGNAVIAYARYVGKMLWPERLAVFYPHPLHWPVWQVMLAAVFVAGVSVAVLVGRRRRPYLTVGWFWYLGTLVPVIGLVQVGRQSMADRYTYLPLIGLFVMLVWGINEALARIFHTGRSRRREEADRRGIWCLTPPHVGGYIAALSMAVCAALTVQQLSYWRNSEALFSHALAVAPNNFVAYHNLALARLKEGRAEEAVAFLREALRIEPNSAEAENDLSHALADTGQVEEALLHLGKALELMEAAQLHLGKASALKPGFAQAHYDLGRALFKKGRTIEAIAQFQKALALSPDFAEARKNLADALANRGQVGSGTKERQ